MHKTRAVLATALVLAVAASMPGAQPVAAQTVSAPQAAFANMNYTWWGELVSTDGKTLTVKVPFRDPVAGYIDQFKPGDGIVLTWAISAKGVADAVLYVASFDVMKASKVDVGYILPVEFVAADKAGKTLTVKAVLPDSAAGAIKGIAPGKTVKVTTPMSQPDQTAKIGAVEAGEKPKA